MTQMRKYSSISQDTTLAAGGISSSATTMTVATGTGSSLMGGITLTTGDTFQIAIDPDTVNEELCYITAQSGDVFTITRAVAGSSAVVHAAGATVRHVMSSDDLNWFNTTSPGTLSTAKGDIIVASGSQAVDNLPAGTNNYALVADSSQTLGVKYQDLSSRNETLTNKDLTSSSNTFPTTLVTTTGTQTLTNKTIDYNSNTITNLPSTSFNLSFNAQTGTTYTLALSDLNKLVTLSNAGAITLTLPPSGTAAFTSGMQVHIQQIGAGQVSVAAGSGVTITSNGATAAAPKLRAQYSAATIICTGTSSFTVIGDIV